MAMNKLTLIRGDDVPITATFTDTDGDAIDLTDYTVVFTVKEKLSDSDANALIQKTVTSHSDPTNGVTIISLTNTDTDNLTGDSSYYWDMQLTNSEGQVSSTKKGVLEVLQDVTLS